MAKKNKKSNKKVNDEIRDDILPQNIVSFGEHAVEDKIIYISQKEYKEIKRFTKDKTENESGGVLVGNVIEEFGKTYIVIRGFIEAKYCEGTPTTLKFTHATWDYIHGEVAKKYPKYKILGWIHTHPNFGIFLSEYDKFIQENFFNEENQIAYVVDPIQNIEGFYCWFNGKIERCKGFCVFDKVGTEITVSDDADKEEQDEVVFKTGSSKGFKIIAVILCIVVSFLSIACLSLNSKITSLTNQLQTVIQDTNTNFAALNNQINILNLSISNLEKRLKELEPISVDVSEAEDDTSKEQNNSEQEAEIIDNDSQINQETTVAESETESVAG